MGERRGKVMKEHVQSTKRNGGRIEGGRWGWVGQGKVVAGEWRQLYLNNNF